MKYIEELLLSSSLIFKMSLTKYRTQIIQRKESVGYDFSSRRVFCGEHPAWLLEKFW